MTCVESQRHKKNHVKRLLFLSDLKQQKALRNIRRIMKFHENSTGGSGVVFRAG
jgi:hypothetical protein